MPQRFDPPITPDILRLVGRIDEFKGAWPGIRNSLPPERLQALKQTAFLENVGAGFRLDGNKLPDKEITPLLATRPAWSFRVYGDKKIAGYTEALDSVMRTSVHEPFTEDYIKQRYCELVRYTHDFSPRHVAYKQYSNILKEFSPEGDVLNTATPGEVPRRLREIVTWANRSLDNPRVHPLLVIPIFAAAFLAISPFPEGNGRLGQLLTLALLQRTGYDHWVYGSLDRILEKRRQGYVHALCAIVKGLSTQTPDWTPWMVFVLEAMEAQARALYEQVTSEVEPRQEEQREATLTNLPVLSARIMAYIHVHDRADMGCLIRETGVSRNTLKGHLRQLLAKGRIRKHGEGRGAWYTHP